MTKHLLSPLFHPRIPSMFVRFALVGAFAIFVVPAIHADQQSRGCLEMQNDTHACMACYAFQGIDYQGKCPADANTLRELAEPPRSESDAKNKEAVRLAITGARILEPNPTAREEQQPPRAEIATTGSFGVETNVPAPVTVNPLVPSGSPIDSLFDMVDEESPLYPVFLISVLLLSLVVLGVTLIEIAKLLNPWRTSTSVVENASPVLEAKLARMDTAHSPQIQFELTDVPAPPPGYGGPIVEVFRRPERRAYAETLELNGRAREAQVARVKQAEALYAAGLQIKRHQQALANLPLESEHERRRLVEEIEQFEHARALRSREREEAEMRRGQDRQRWAIQQELEAENDRAAVLDAKLRSAQSQKHLNDCLAPAPPPKSPEERRLEARERRISATIDAIEDLVELKRQTEALKAIYPTEFHELINRRYKDAVIRLNERG